MTRAEIERAVASIPTGAEAVKVTDADGAEWFVFADGSRGPAGAWFSGVVA